jgi:hypothetical protein
MKHFGCEESITLYDLTNTYFGVLGEGMVKMG